MKIEDIHNKKITKEILENLHTNRYHNNEMIRVGDIALIVMIEADDFEKINHNNYKSLKIEIALIRENQIGKVYELSHRSKGSRIPHVKIKKQ